MFQSTLTIELELELENHASSMEHGGPSRIESGAHVPMCTGDWLSDREAARCFIWSIMCVINGQSEDGRLRETHLPFEGFLEAVCRLAALTPLPTDEELADTGVQDAGLYMIYLSIRDPDAYQALLSERVGAWGRTPDNQPFHRCVEHLITLMLRRVENAGRDLLEGGRYNITGDAKLSEPEFRHFADGLH